MKRSPVRKKRPGPPRRGRVVNLEYMAWMHQTQQPLIAPFDSFGDSNELHHVRRCAGDQKDDTRTVMLTAFYHRLLKDCVEKIGDRRFQAKYGLDFEAEIQRCNAAYVAQGGKL